MTPPSERPSVRAVGDMAAGNLDAGNLAAGRVTPRQRGRRRLDPRWSSGGADELRVVHGDSEGRPRRHVSEAPGELLLEPADPDRGLPRRGVGVTAIALFHRLEELLHQAEKSWVHGSLRRLG